MDKQLGKELVDGFAKLLFNEYSKEEKKFLNAVLVEVKNRSEGKVHISFNYEAVVKDFHKSRTALEVVDEAFEFVDKIESGEIETTPYVEDLEQEWCGPGCECFPDPATESEADKAARLKRQAEVQEILRKVSAEL
jgi:hypothetical protein